MLVFAAAGLVCVATGAPAASARTSAVPVLPAGTATSTYSCTGADPDTQSLLDGVGLSTFPLSTTVNSAQVDSPDQGQPLTMTFTWHFTLSTDLVAISIGLGLTELDFHDVNLPMAPTTGVSGSDIVGTPGPQAVSIGDGSQPVTYSEGPFSGTVTRTSAIGDPVVFTPGTVHSSVTVLGTIVLNFVCTPGGDTVPLSVVDDTSGTTTTTQATTSSTTGGSTSSSVAGTSTTAGTTAPLPVTGGINLRLVVLALALIDIGYLAWSAGQPPRRRRRPTAT
jgi:hypothetical protein